ncbi:helix-turn-helix transcriptional regulator [Latilactobacillus sakei]
MIEENDSIKLLNYFELNTVKGGGSKEIAGNLRKIRLSKEITRTKVADALTVDVTTIARYEEGKRIPDIDTLVALSKLYEKKIEEIIY